MKNNLKKFTVSAVLNLNVTVDVTARSLEEALQKSKELKDHDFVEILGEYLDGSFEVTGIY